VIAMPVAIAHPGYLYYPYGALIYGACKKIAFVNRRLMDESSTRGKKE
jgi:hypothetical protein